MASLRVPHRILWAIDAFEAPSSPLLRATAQLVTGLIARFSSQVEPVYVLSPAELNLSSEFSIPWVSRYRSYAEQALVELVKRLNVRDLAQPKVLVQEH